MKKILTTLLVVFGMLMFSGCSSTSLNSLNVGPRYTYQLLSNGIMLRFDQIDGQIWALREGVWKPISEEETPPDTL